MTKLTYRDDSSQTYLMVQDTQRLSVSWISVSGTRAPRVTAAMTSLASVIRSACQVAANIRVSIFRAEKFVYKSTNVHVSESHSLQRPAQAHPGTGPRMPDRHESTQCGTAEPDARGSLCPVRHVGRTRSPDPHAFSCLVFSVLVKAGAGAGPGIRQSQYKEHVLHAQGTSQRS